MGFIIQAWEEVLGCRKSRILDDGQRLRACDRNEKLQLAIGNIGAKSCAERHFFVRRRIRHCRKTAYGAVIGDEQEFDLAPPYAVDHST